MTQKRNIVYKAFRYAFIALTTIIVVYVAMNAVCLNLTKKNAKLRAINRELILHNDSLLIQARARVQLLMNLEESITNKNNQLRHERIQKTIQQAH